MKKIKKKAFFDDGRHIQGIIKSHSNGNGSGYHESFSKPYLLGENEFEFKPADIGQRSYPFNLKGPFENDHNAQPFSSEPEIQPESTAFSTPFDLPNQEAKFSDVFEIDDDEIFSDVEDVDISSQQSEQPIVPEIETVEKEIPEPIEEASNEYNEPQLPKKETPEVDVSKAKADEAKFDKISNDLKNLQTYQLGEVELETDFDLFDQIIDKSKRSSKSVSNTKDLADSFSGLSEMDIAEDFELIDETIEKKPLTAPASKSFAEEGTPIVLNVTRVFEDDVAALSVASINRDNKSLKFYMIADKSSGNKIKDGAYKTFIKLPSQINEQKDGTKITTAQFINQFKGMEKGSTTKDYPVFQFHLDYIKGGGTGLRGPIPPGGNVTGHAGNTHHDSLGCEVFGNVLSIDHELKQIWDPQAPGVIGHYIQIENSRKTLEVIFDFIGDIYEQDKVNGKTPVITAVFNTNLVTDTSSLDYMLRDGRKIPVEDFYNSIQDIKENQTVKPGQSRDNQDL